LALEHLSDCTPAISCRVNTVPAKLIYAVPPPDTRGTFRYNLAGKPWHGLPCILSFGYAHRQHTALIGCPHLCKVSACPMKTVTFLELYL